MGLVHISYTRFKTLEADANASEQVLSFTETGDTTGIMVTPDVTIDFNYDVSRQILHFTVGERHSLAAHLASDNVIERYLTSVLFNLAESTVTKGLKNGGFPAPVLVEGIANTKATDQVENQPSAPKSPAIDGIKVKPPLAAATFDNTPKEEHSTEIVEGTNQPAIET